LDSARCTWQIISNAGRNSNQVGGVMDQQEKSNNPKLGRTVGELARGLSVSVPFLRLEVRRGRLKAAHLGRRVVLPDAEVRRYLEEANAVEVMR
jgi:excisionase family DNA binding protein